MDSFIAFNEKPLLRTASSISNEQMKRVARERYGRFDPHRHRPKPLPPMLKSWDA